MKKFILAILAVLPMLAVASGPSLHLDEANNDLRDKESLKRGFGAYVNNCLVTTVLLQILVFLMQTVWLIICIPVKKSVTILLILCQQKKRLRGLVVHHQI